MTRLRALAGAVALCGARPAAAHWRTLVYGPTDGWASSVLAARGHFVTVWDDAAWRAAATEDFEAFDVIVIGGGTCTTGSAGLDAASDTQSVWRPAVTGAVLVTGLAPECQSGRTEAENFVYDAAEFVGYDYGPSLIVTSDGGQRSLDLLAEFGALSSTTSVSDTVTAVDSSHEAWGYVAVAELSGWGDSVASTLGGLPSDFETLATDSSGAPVMVWRPGCDQDVDEALREGGTCGGDDCDDESYFVYPLSDEYCDGIDNDCDTVVDEDPTYGGETFFLDVDGDGFGDASVSDYQCAAPAGYVGNSEDCDDSTALVHPDADEVCDGLDNDCNGSVDGSAALDVTEWFLDADGDGFGGETSVFDCVSPARWVDVGGDCDDSRSTVSPGSPETCGGLDDDCDGVIDEADAIDARSWYRDFDGDGFGDPLIHEVSCDAPLGMVANRLDCNDAFASIAPGQDEVWYDGIDQDCFGMSDEYDADGDGVDAVPFGADCDDTDAGVWPGAIEIWYDGVDQDCDARDDFDADSDGWALDADCDESDASVHPEALETWYDGVDQDCDGQDDFDADQDGVVRDDDCDDADSSIRPGAAETWYDGIDQNCDDQDDFDADQDGWPQQEDCDDSDDTVWRCEEHTGPTTAGKSDSATGCSAAGGGLPVSVWLPASAALFFRRRYLLTAASDGTRVL